VRIIAIAAVLLVFAVAGLLAIPAISGPHGTPTPVGSPAQTQVAPSVMPAASPTLTPLPTPTPAPSPAPTLTPAPTCRYQGETDQATIERLIAAEAEAANSGDLTIISAIFAPDAVIRDAVSGMQWTDPIARYQEMFASTTFTGARHSDIQPAGVGISGSDAWFTSASSGRYVAGGQAGTYTNPPGSDHWTFRKDGSGCWVIARFTFNASHIPFP
jgi:ketosteroid isomerase-like protein